MNKFEKLIQNKIIQNILVWLFIYVIFFTSTVESETSNIFLDVLYISLFLASIVYINNLLILPVLKKNKVLFVGLLLLNALLYTIISIQFIDYGTKGKSKFEQSIGLFGLIVLVAFIASALKLARDSYIKSAKNKDAELKLLKAQLNPHFLFNTLNNLYGLSVLKSDKLPDLMLKLSDLLRYSLYDTKEQFVPLEKEIKYLENYISLEKIRLENKTNIQFQKTGDFNMQKIAPMLLIVFVENAFKHLNKEGDSNVIITIKIINDSLKFTCKNTFDKTEVSKKQIESNKSGIGLENAKKRLELIYPNNHNIVISQNKELFIVELLLNHFV